MGMMRSMLRKLEAQDRTTSQRKEKTWSGMTGASIVNRRGERGWGVACQRIVWSSSIKIGRERLCDRTSRLHDFPDHCVLPWCLTPKMGAACRTAATGACWHGSASMGSTFRVRRGADVYRYVLPLHSLHRNRILPMRLWRV